jgi:hypothetical protein
VVKPLTQLCIFKLLKPCRSFSGEFDLTKMFPKSSFNMATQPHISLKTQVAITELGRTHLTCPPFSPDLAHSGFHLFGALEGAVCAKGFGSDDEVIEEVKKLLRVQNSN